MKGFRQETGFSYFSALSDQGCLLRPGLLSIPNYPFWVVLDYRLHYFLPPVITLKERKLKNKALSYDIEYKRDLLGEIYASDLKGLIIKQISGLIRKILGFYARQL
jgi:hypothetical protein